MAASEHGGDLDRAITKYGGNRKDWVDLSTGINPYAYPVSNIASSLSSDLLRELPDQQLIDTATQSAKNAYQANFSSLPLAGAQQAIQLFPSIIEVGSKKACILHPSYNEYEAQLQKTGWQITYCHHLDEMTGADCAIITNPNNPDGRQFLPTELLELAHSVGTLIIDESFCDLYPHLSVLPLTTEQHQNIIVFRSLGKFYGLAGLRLGFVFSHSKTLNQFASAAGKWAVSAPALAIGADALQDENWRQQTMIKLTHDAKRLDRIAHQNGLHLIGGTDLFRLYQFDNAKNIQDKLAGHKIWSRVFSYSENWIRLGIPPDTGWEPLERALQS